jgi:tetratricopeptide (TPR) repeat protein
MGWITMGHALEKAPSKLVDLISARLSSLLPATRLMLQAIAIHGTLVHRALLEATLDGDAAANEQSLAELEQLGLIVIDGEIISIRSEIVASLASACVPADARRSMHENVLQIMDAGESPASAPVMAYHAEEAGELTRAYGYCLRAGGDAERRFDDPGSIYWYRRAQYIARRLTALGEPEGSPWFIESSIRLADVLRFGGQLDLARGILDEAQLYDPAMEQHAGIVRCQGRLAAAGCDFASARDLFQKSIGLSMRAGQWEFVCETYIDQAGVMAQIEDHAVIVEELHEGINVVTLGEGFAATRVPDKLWLLGLRLASLHFQANHLEEAERIASEALVQAERSRSKQACGRLYSLLARIAEVSGDVERARDYRARAIDQMRSLGDRLSTAELLLANARTASQGEDAGASSRTKEAQKKAYELAREIGWEEGMRLPEGDE